jgi:succinate dehydrogenase / fumarate reductase cytochrome b subunit
MRTEVIDTHRGGMWPWLGQRVTAVVVIVTIIVHLVLTHYINIGEISYDNIAGRLANTAVLINDVLLLLAVVYHGLNGFRMVVLDYWLSSAGSRRALDAVLWIVGIAATVYGIWALWVWVV